MEPQNQALQKLVTAALERREHGVLPSGMAGESPDAHAQRVRMAINALSARIMPLLPNVVASGAAITIEYSEHRGTAYLKLLLIPQVSAFWTIWPTEFDPEYTWHLEGPYDMTDRETDAGPRMLEEVLLCMIGDYQEQLGNRSLAFFAEQPQRQQ